MEKYFEILENMKLNRLDITKLYILSSTDNRLSKEERVEQMNYVYDLWLDADVDLDLSRMTDIVIENWKKIKNGKMTDEEILDETVCY